jgi:hypothetical protein
MLDLNTVPDDVINLISMRLNDFNDFLRFVKTIKRKDVIVDIDNYIINNKHNLIKLLQSDLSKTFVKNTQYQFIDLVTKDWAKNQIIPIWKKEVVEFIGVYIQTTEFDFISTYDHIITQNDEEGLRFLLELPKYSVPQYNRDLLANIPRYELEQIMGSFGFHPIPSMITAPNDPMYIYKTNLFRSIILHLTHLTYRELVIKMINLGRKKFFEILFENAVTIVLYDFNDFFNILQLFKFDFEIIFRNTVLIYRPVRFLSFCINTISEKDDLNLLELFEQYTQTNLEDMVRHLDKNFTINLIEKTIIKRNTKFGQLLIEINKVQQIIRDEQKLYDSILKTDNHQLIKIILPYINFDKTAVYLGKKPLSIFLETVDFRSLNIKDKNTMLWCLIYNNNISIINYIFENGLMYAKEIDKKQLKTLNLDRYPEIKKLLKSRLNFI